MGSVFFVQAKLCNLMPLGPVNLVRRFANILISHFIMTNIYIYIYIYIYGNVMIPTSIDVVSKRTGSVIQKG